MSSFTHHQVDLLGYKHSSEYLPLCSAEHRHVYRFEQLKGE